MALVMKGINVTGRTSFSKPIVPDPYYSSVTLLMHMDGTNGSTTFVDNSPSPKTMTPSGAAQVSTAQVKFGTGSLILNGTTSFITTPTNAGWQFGTGDFTVESWVYKTSAANGPIVDARGASAATPWAFYIDASNFPYFYNGTSYTSSTAITNSVWNHVAVTRASGTLRIFVNGAVGFTGTVAGALSPTATLHIGGVNFTTPSYTTGYFDDLRITKGVARYTGTFTPPTAPFPNS